MKISEFNKDMTNNEEKSKAFGALLRKYRNRECELVIEKPKNYNFLAVLKRMSSTLH
jgi:hypothetical protein